MSDVRNILVGAAQLFVSRGTGAYRPVTKPGVSMTQAQTISSLVNTQGDVNWTPATSARNYLTNSSYWRDAGYTNTGLEVSYEPGYNDVVVDQLLDAARLFKHTLKVILRTSLTEGTLENLQLVFGQNEKYTTYAGGAGNYPVMLNNNTGGATSASISASGSTLATAANSVTTSPISAGGALWNVVRNSSGAVATVILVDPGNTAASGSATLYGSAQFYPGGVTGSAANDVTINIVVDTASNANATLNIEAGALGDAPVERSIVAVGNAPAQFGATASGIGTASGTIKNGTSNVTTTNKERVYVARRVVQVITSSHGLKRDAATEFPVEFRCLPDDSDLYDGAEYGVIIDRVYTNA